MRHLTAIAALVCMGCATTIQVELRPLPAIDVDLSAVAVVSASRECTDVADLLVRRLAAAPGIHVSPDAELRVQLDQCGLVYQPQVELEQVVHSDGSVISERTATVDGRAYAIVQIQTKGIEQARLLASARNTDTLPQAGGFTRLFRPNRSIARDMREALVDDLVRQISPMPMLVQRRIYPGAHDGSARDFYNQAVLAELSGDLHQAHRLAVKAETRSDDPTISRYAAELARQLDPAIPSD